MAYLFKSYSLEDAVHKLPSRRAIVVGGVAFAAIGPAHASNRVLWADQLANPGISTFGTRWNAFTDRVMGGVSDVQADVTQVEGQLCYRMTGEVRTANNGGFVQMALSLPGSQGTDLSEYAGIRMKVWGNDESYCIHLRTAQNRAPWDYFTANFRARPKWTTVDLPFSAFTRARSGSDLDTSRVMRLAIVGYGRDFSADVALAGIGFYRK